MRQASRSMQSRIPSVLSRLLMPRGKVQLWWLLGFAGILLCGVFSLAAGPSRFQEGNSFASQGLGITRLEFERFHNLPTKVIPDSRWTSELHYGKSGYYHIYFWYNGPGAQSFEESLIKEIGLNMPEKDRTEILTEVRKFLPADAMLKETKEKNQVAQVSRG